ncbi:MAG: hypothetical protein FJ167_06575 [Gammaproteobacteria bacterium]|nr:hypothetical protein [Gammaproteobacteria bacterium]
MKKELPALVGELYTVHAPISGYCYAWQEGKPSVDLRHGDQVLYLYKDLTQSAMRNQPICAVLTHKGQLFMDQRWLGHVQPAGGGVE